MSNWGVSKKASKKEEIKAEMSDFLGGMNSCGELSYRKYSEIWDFAMPLFDKMYELGKEEARG